LTYDLDFGEPGAAAWSPNGEQIVFNAGTGPDADGHYDHDLYLIDADGSGLRRITEGETTDLDPSWSPDGEWIAFHRDCSLWLVHPDGTGARDLLPASDDLCVGGTAWSPNGQHIAFPNWHSQDKAPEIWVVGRDGSDPHVAHAWQQALEWSVAAWSPNGSRLACIFRDERGTRGLVVDPQGGEPVSLSENELPWHWLPNHRLWEGAWPLAKRPPPAEGERWVVIDTCEGIEPWQICIRDLESGEGVQLTYDLDFGEPGAASWSPDGRQIVFNGGSDTQATGRYDHKLYIINVDGSGLHRITEGGTNDVDPSWSPDGEWIAFHRSCALWLVHPDGTAAHELLPASDDLCVGGAVWSPDSERIAFPNWHSEEDAHEIWVIGRDGSDPHVAYALRRRIEWLRVAWSPDGGRLACLFGGNEGNQGFLVDPAGGDPEWLGGDELPWHWSPNYRVWEGVWPPKPRPPAGSAHEDPWGAIVIPPGEPIGIGMVADFSGSVSAFGPLFENAVHMAVEEHGEIAGFPVAVVVADGGCEPEMSIVAAQTMIGDPVIAGIIGHSCSGSCEAALPLYEEAGRVVISPSCTQPDLSDRGFAVFNRVVVRDDLGGEERNRAIVTTDRFREFAARYEERYDQRLDAEGAGIYAAYAHDAAATLLSAIAKVAVVDDAGTLIVGRQALAEAVRATPGQRGVTGLIRFDERGDRVP
jgi:Tol biopolymer transport system component